MEGEKTGGDFEKVGDLRWENFKGGYHNLFVSPLLAGLKFRSWVIFVYSSSGNSRLHDIGLLVSVHVLWKFGNY